MAVAVQWRTHEILQSHDKGYGGVGVGARLRIEFGPFRLQYAIPLEVESALDRLSAGYGAFRADEMTIMTGGGGMKTRI